jgi:hypothetical protein
VADPLATMAVGQPLTTTAAFTLDKPTTDLAVGALHWVTFKGTIITKPSASKAGLALKFPKTKLGNGTGGETNATAKGSTLAGTKVGAFSFVLGDLGVVKLTGFDKNGNNLGSVVFPDGASFGRCNNLAGTTPIKNGATTLATTIVKDSSTTTVKAKYRPARHVTKVKATVLGRYGVPGTGKVKVALMKGTHTLKTVRAKLNKKGVAKVAIKKPLTHGKYKVKVKFGGDARLKKSHGATTFKVR